MPTFVIGILLSFCFISLHVQDSSGSAGNFAKLPDKSIGKVTGENLEQASLRFLQPNSELFVQSKKKIEEILRNVSELES